MRIVVWGVVLTVIGMLGMGCQLVINCLGSGCIDDEFNDDSTSEDSDTEMTMDTETVDRENRSCNDFDIEPFDFEMVFSAHENERYVSNSVVITGLPDGQRAELVYGRAYAPARSCDYGAVYINGERIVGNRGFVINGDEVVVDLMTDRRPYTACIVDVNGFQDLFAVTVQSPPTRAPRAEGTRSDPLYLDIRGNNQHRGQVDDTASYYKFDNVDNDLYMQFNDLTDFVSISFYTNPDFQAPPLCASYAPRLDWAYINNCDIENVETLYVKIEGPCVGDGAFYDMGPVI
jgi:hypothetical protein